MCVIYCYSVLYPAAQLLIEVVRKFFNGQLHRSKAPARQVFVIERITYMNLVKQA